MTQWFDFSSSTCMSLQDDIWKKWVGFLKQWHALAGLHQLTRTDYLILGNFESQFLNTIFNNR